LSYLMLDVEFGIRNSEFGGRFILRCEACRVDPGGYPPRSPTDPDVQNSRIRLLRHMGSLRDGRSSG